MSENAIEVLVPVVGTCTPNALRKNFKTNSPWVGAPWPLGHDGGLRAGNGPVFLEGAHAGEGQSRRGVRGDIAQREGSAAVAGNGLKRRKADPTHQLRMTHTRNTEKRGTMLNAWNLLMKISGVCQPI